MDVGDLSLCGEESFGTGSDHIREKDGIWACLAWLNVIAILGKSIENILLDHWKIYGRNFFTRYNRISNICICVTYINLKANFDLISYIIKFLNIFIRIFRYDYENCDCTSANKMMEGIETLIHKPDFIGRKLQHENKEYVVKQANNYSYTDPVDNSIAMKQVCTVVLTFCTFISTGT